MEDFSFSDLIKQAEATGFTALPPNEYDVVVDSAEARTITSSGKRKITARFKVLSGPHAGRIVFNDFVLTTGNPNALVIWFRHMSLLGLDSRYFAMNPPLEQVAKDLTGKKVRLKLGVRTWNDVERNSVLAIMPLASGTAAPVPGPQFAPPVPQPAAAAKPVLPPAPVPPVPSAASPAPAPAPAPAPEPVVVIFEEESFTGDGPVPAAEPAAEAPPAQAAPPDLPFLWKPVTG